MNNSTRQSPVSQSPIYKPPISTVSYVVGVHVGDHFAITEEQFLSFYKLLNDHPDTVFVEIKPGTYLNINNIAYFDKQLGGQP